MSTIDAFKEIAKAEPEAANYWLEKLAALDIENFCEIVDQVPIQWMSQDARAFALKMLEINRLRLLGRS